MQRAQNERPSHEAKPLFGLWMTQRDDSGALILRINRQLFIGRLMISFDQAPFFRISATQLR